MNYALISQLEQLQKVYNTYSYAASQHFSLEKELNNLTPPRVEDYLEKLGKAPSKPTKPIEPPKAYHKYEPYQESYPRAPILETKCNKLLIITGILYIICRIIAPSVLEHAAFPIRIALSFAFAGSLICASGLSVLNILIFIPHLISLIKYRISYSIIQNRNLERKRDAKRRAARDSARDDAEAMRKYAEDMQKYEKEMQRYKVALHKYQQKRQAYEVYFQKNHPLLMQKYQQERQRIMDRLEEANQQYFSCIREYNELARKIGLSSEYQYNVDAHWKKVVGAIDLVCSGQADSIKEALNIHAIQQRIDRMNQNLNQEIDKMNQNMNQEINRINAQMNQDMKREVDQMKQLTGQYMLAQLEMQRAAADERRQQMEDMSSFMAAIMEEGKEERQEQLRNAQKAGERQCRHCRLGLHCTYRNSNTGNCTAFIPYDDMLISIK